MNEKLLFDFAKWLICAAVLLAALTSCNPYEELQVTPTPTATATARATKMVAQPTPTPRACIVSTGIDAGNLNLRTGAGVGYSVVQIVREGQTLIVKSTRGQWVRVITPAGVAGWVNSKYCIGE